MPPLASRAIPSVCLTSRYAQQRRPQWPQSWLGPSGIGTSTVYLTLAELTELSAAIEGLILPYIEARVIDDVAARPPGSVPVDITVFAIPAARNPPAPAGPAGPAAHDEGE